MGALSLSITETVLIFVGVPAVVIAVVYAAVYTSTARRADKRYRPGRTFTFAPVWFLAAAGPLAGEPTGTPAIAGATVAALPAGEAAPTGHREAGGASDKW